MSCWLTPELKPFVGRTYFPKDRFVSVLESIADKWRTSRAEVIQRGDEVMSALTARLASAVAEGGDATALLETRLPRDVLERGVMTLLGQFDEQYGGFGRGIKFPQPSRFDFLFRVYALEGRSSSAGAQALSMALASLDAMARGGINDHIAQGFARYSTDARWHVPHFEKMLYDNAQLAVSYVEAFQISHNNAYAKVARDILTYLQRDMTDPNGGFYSAQDADSYPYERATEKKEGAFCVWTAAEITEVITAAGLPDLPIRGDGGGGVPVPASRLFKLVYGVQPQGNVDPLGDPHGELLGKNVLYLAKTAQEAVDALQLDCPVEEAEAILAACRAALLEARSKRPPPHLDDKIITAWNGLAISAFARAAQAFTGTEEGENYLRTATRAASFIRESLYTDRPDTLSAATAGGACTGGTAPGDAGGTVPGGSSGGASMMGGTGGGGPGGGDPSGGGGDGTTGGGALYRSYRGGRRSDVLAFADDYAFLVRGLLDLYEADPRRKTGHNWLRWARKLQSEMDVLFGCPPEEGGGYYTTRAGDPRILLRLKNDYDGAEPSASNVAATNLQRLAVYFDEDELRRRAAAALAQALRQPGVEQAMPEMLAALVVYLLHPTQVIIAGKAGAVDTRRLLHAALAVFAPGRAVLLREEDAEGDAAAAAISGAPSAALEAAEFSAGAGAGWDDRGKDVFAATFAAYGCKSIDGRAAAYVCRQRACSLPVGMPEELARSIAVV